MNNVNWLKIVGAVSSAVLLSLVLYGSYQYYFSKPIPVINNNTFQAGSNPKIEQGKQKEGIGAQIGLLAGPLYVGGKFGGFVGGMVSFKF